MTVRRVVACGPMVSSKSLGSIEMRKPYENHVFDMRATEDGAGIGEGGLVDGEMENGMKG